ncbi:MAG: GNAT family N-acetyltransferase [Chloroflexi bacterium]|nr:MAG: GNAT family N-acetyltransferase [Chloroflexota bacterium]TME72567.1 MAG: GNAT family N-acetyltransferase [Chloroflexota bacterium]
MAPSVRAVAFDAAMWRELGPRMLELERQEWGSRAFSEREMRWQATNRDAVVMTSWDGPTLIGFAVAGPPWTKGRASLLNVLIDPAYRGRGLVWPLIAAVERALSARGIRELEIDARVENGFADAIERRYKTRATVIAVDHASPYGPQRTIRVDLKRGAARPRRTRGAPRSQTPRGRVAVPGRRARRTRPPTR